MQRSDGNSDHVHRHAEPSPVRRVRSLQPADRFVCLSNIRNMYIVQFPLRPTCSSRLLEVPHFVEQSSSLAGFMAGAPCPVEVCKACIEKMHMKDLSVGSLNVAFTDWLLFCSAGVDIRTYRTYCIREHVVVRSYNTTQ